MPGLQDLFGDPQLLQSIIQQISQGQQGGQPSGGNPQMPANVQGMIGNPQQTQQAMAPPPVSGMVTAQPPQQGPQGWDQLSKASAQQGQPFDVRHPLASSFLSGLSAGFASKLAPGAFEATSAAARQKSSEDFQRQQEQLKLQQAQEERKQQEQLEQQRLSQRQAFDMFLRGGVQTPDEVTAQPTVQTQLGIDNLPDQVHRMQPALQAPAGSFSIPGQGNWTIPPEPVKEDKNLMHVTNGEYADEAKKMGLKPNEDGSYSFPPAVFDQLSKTVEATRNRTENKAQVLQKAGQVKSWLHTAFAGGKDPMDSTMLESFQQRADSASTPAQLESIQKDAENYMVSNGPEARRRNANDRAAMAMSGYMAKKQYDKNENLSHSDGTYQYMMKTGTSPDILLKGMNPAARMDIVSDWIDKGLPLPTYLTSAGQKMMTEINSTQDIAKSAMDLLNQVDPKTGKPYSASNTPFSALPARIQYAIGEKNNMSSLINRLEVFKGIASGRIASGAGLHTQEFVDMIKAHTPDVKKDSGQMIAQKLKDINDYLSIQQKNVIKNNNKWGMIRSSGVVDEGAPQQGGEPLSDDEFLNSLKNIVGGKK